MAIYGHIDMSENKELFNKLRDQLVLLDPVAFVEKYLTLEGEPFRLSKNGYKPFADIYRYIGIKALEPDSKPVIMVKGRQVGGTTMAGALEMYFMGSGLFGTENKPPIRVIHAFPLLELAAAYSKTKLSQMMSTSLINEEDKQSKKGGKIKSYMQALLDTSSPTNDSLHFKQFIGGNHLWIESTGIDADRLMGRMLALDTDVPTPNGFVKLIDLKQGDSLFDENGKICKITKLHPIDLKPDSYKVCFDDGTEIKACADHLWLTTNNLNTEVRTTIQILNTINSQHIINKCGSNNNCIKRIINIKRIPSEPMRCITVDNSSGLFLVTKSFIPTHNTADVLFFDECLPASQVIATDTGRYSIGKLYNLFRNEKKLPLVLSFNEKEEIFEYKKIINAWKRDKRNLVSVVCYGRKIKCTENHKFLTENGWVEAGNLSNGDLLKINCNKSSYVRAINADQEQIILGSFLGDGCIRNEGKSRYRLSVIHGIKQKDYCKWKAKVFNCNTKIIKNNGYSKTLAINFTTNVFGIKQEFPKTKTTCPQWILDKLDARGIAIWFMDDGSITKKWNDNCSATISTCSFDEDSQIRFVEKFNKLGIDCHYKKYSGYYYLFFNKNGFKQLVNLIKPYVHESMFYKINTDFNHSYIWDNKYKSYGFLVVNKIIYLQNTSYVYDLEIEDNHNFIVPSNDRTIINNSGPIVHNCQRTSGLAMGNALKILTNAKYGRPTKGVQVYFGTPRNKGSDFYKMWQVSSQQYYYLGCEGCGKHFPLYTPGSDDWKEIWIYDKIVKCPHCGTEQDKLAAADRGKWVALKDHNDPDCKMIGFHINQLYMPKFTRLDIDNEMPGKHPINTDRIYHTEVLGEFYQGDSSPITPEEIAEACADVGRKFKARISPGDEHIVVLGIDYGKRADLEQLANPDKAVVQGQSYSTAVVLSAKGPGLLSIEFATKFKRNDTESKKGIIEQILRQYSIDLAVGDIGFSQGFSEMMHQSHGDRYIVSRAHGKVNHYVKYNVDAFPKEIIFERDYYIRELYEQMKKGQIRFPYGDYEKIAWLVEHCASMEIKPSISKTGADPVVHYVKGSTPNDGFMALLNAYLAYKFLVTQGFTNNNPLLQGNSIDDIHKPLVVIGHISRRF